MKSNQVASEEGKHMQNIFFKNSPITSKNLKNGKPIYNMLKKEDKEKYSNKKKNSSMSKEKSFKDDRSGYNILKEENEKLQNKYNTLKQQKDQLLKKFQVSEKELSTSQVLINKLKDEKYENEEKLLKQKEYIRKLESCISSNNKTNYFNEIIDNVKEENGIFKDKNSELIIQNQNLSKKLKEMEKEKQGYIKALDLKLEDLRIKSDIKGGLLYEVGFAKSQIHDLELRLKSTEENLSETKRQLQLAKNTISELELIRNSNNEELTRLEEEILKTKEERDLLINDIQKSGKEENKLKELINDQNNQISKIKKEFLENNELYNNHINDLQDKIRVNEQMIFERDTTIDILNTKVNEIEKSKEDAYKELQLIREKNQDEFKKKQSEFEKMQELTIENTKKSNTVEHLKLETENFKKLLEQRNSQIDELKRANDLFANKLISYEKEITNSKQSSFFSEQNLKENLNVALKEMEVIVKEKESMKKLNETLLEKINESETSNLKLQDAKLKLESQIENLIASKQILHQTLNGQIISIQARLDDAFLQKEKINENLRIIQKSNNELQERVKIEQLKNKSLLEEIRKYKR